MTKGELEPVEDRIQDKALKNFGKTLLLVLSAIESNKERVLNILPKDFDCAAASELLTKTSSRRLEKQSNITVDY